MADTTTARRAKSRTDTDVTHLASDVTRALKAFGLDVSYAVQMARAATIIERKRTVWSERRHRQA